MSTYSAQLTLTVTGLSSLTSGSSATSNVYDATGNKPVDVLLELAVTVGTTSNNTRALLYLITSTDGTNFSDSANDTNMIFLGMLLTPTTGGSYRSREFSVAAACGGSVPNHFKVVVKNDGGGTYTAGAITYRDLT